LFVLAGKVSCFVVSIVRNWLSLRLSGEEKFVNDLSERIGAPRFAIVVPTFNEAFCIGEFHRRLSAAMSPLGTWYVLYVDDGSTDETACFLNSLQKRDTHVAVLHLSRNFGKETATTAGLDHVQGEAIIVIDADLQDPPEVIPELVRRWEEGFETVYAQRRIRNGETWLKRKTSSIFYRLMQGGGTYDLPRDTGDFRLMSARVVREVTRLREQHRFMKGLFAWGGFSSIAVQYDRAPRHAGKSKWNYWTLWNLAIEGITGHTVVPLKFATYLGLLTSFGAMLFAAQLILRTILFGNPVAGYPSLMVIVLFIGGIQLTTNGVIGEYLGRVFNETKQRPLYIVNRFAPATLNQFATGSEAATMIWPSLTKADTVTRTDETCR
jgi:polyisoprenyl-phosphate glycosyltransferase